MRTKLSEILSSFDQYNGIGEYSDKFKDGDKMDIRTSMPDIPEIATISESEQRTICDLLKENNIKGTARISLLDNSYSYVMSFDRFINEQKGTPSNVQSYMGELDDEDDDWEEE